VGWRAGLGRAAGDAVVPIAPPREVGTKLLYLDLQLVRLDEALGVPLERWTGGSHRCQGEERRTQLLCDGRGGHLSGRSGRPRAPRRHVPRVFCGRGDINTIKDSISNNTVNAVMSALPFSTYSCSSADQRAARCLLNGTVTDVTERAVRPLHLLTSKFRQMDCFLVFIPKHWMEQNNKCSGPTPSRPGMTDMSKTQTNLDVEQVSRHAVKKGSQGPT
jgi:hypothetical protein